MNSPEDNQQLRERAKRVARPWWIIAWIAGAFSFVIGATLLTSHLESRPTEILKSAELTDAKAQLRLNPLDEQTKKLIRELDLKQRQEYFRRLSQMHSGTYLLLVGTAVLVVAAVRIVRLYKQSPMPAAKFAAVSDVPGKAKLARQSVALAGLAVGAFLLLLSLGTNTALPQRTADIDKIADSGAPVVSSDVASSAEMKLSWPRFRGPEGGGVSSFTNAPQKWDAKSGAGISWKTPVPAKGFNSPIIWAEKIFFSGGDATTREVFCLDAKTGKMQWHQAVANVPGSPTQALEIPDTTGYAAGSMATDGRRVYVIFANGDVAAFSLEGKPVWSKSFGPLKNPYGYATSLATWKDKLVLQLDQGESEENKSKLYALDGATGQIFWQRPRKVGSSWATPIVIEAAGKQQIITLAVPWVIAYAANDGSELWRLEGLNGEITPSPVYGGGLVIAVSPSDKVFSIRPNSQGDITKSGVAWTTEENVPDVTSPISNGELVFTITTSGMLTCFSSKDGKKLWEHDYDMEFHASPGIAGNRLYLFGQKGAAIVVEAAPQFKELYRTEMGDIFHASPAFMDGRIIMRGVTNIWCLGEAPK
ncbi:MAG TPA: PQQ-binding-like beta-propeller repeat protein [Candidatus Limnocylindrales bacterium]|jgi:outer membrane protein assembly factor BamB|nr:PQQ-binding-like beta-propeller repeat protein [Candidatus Limnocylindrales bacterium]